MSEMRQKDQADFDLETFVDLFDTAMTSDNPAVKKAFKNLLMISAIVNSEQSNSGIRRGPLRRLVEDIQHLNRRIGTLENGRTVPSPNVPIPSGPYINTPFVISPGTITPGTSASPMPSVQPHTGTPNWPPGTITCSARSTTAYDDQYAPDLTAMSVLNKLEVK